jgi:hypothetical protein
MQGTSVPCAAGRYASEIWDQRSLHALLRGGEVWPSRGFKHFSALFSAPRAFVCPKEDFTAEKDRVWAQFPGVRHPCACLRESLIFLTMSARSEALIKY